MGKPLITINDYLSSSGKYPERATHPECTPIVLANAAVLLSKVNELLKELGVTSVKVSSGFRTSTVNAGIPTAAKKSSHVTGEGIDIVDPKNELSKKVTKELLDKYDLYREDYSFTPTWLHLQTRRTVSGKRIFRP